MVHQKIYLFVNLFFDIVFCIYYIYSILSNVLLLLPNDRAQESPAESGTRNNPTLVTDNVKDVAVAPVITTVSTDSNIDVSNLYFLYVFLFLIFVFKVSNHFFIVINRVVKTNDIIQLLFGYLF